MLLRTSTISLFALIVFTSSTALGNSYFAAMCAAKGKTCDKNIATKSKVCLPRTWFVKQPSACRDSACDYCMLAFRKRKYPCNSKPIGRICGVSTPPPMPTSAPTSAPGSKCGYHANAQDAIVVPFDRLMPKDGWTRVSRSSYTGLVYRKDLNRGIKKAGTSGVYCFTMFARTSGSYQMTAMSYTPHHTEHNDMWVKSSLGFSFWYNGRNWAAGKAGPQKWVKAYQNNAGRIADYLHHKDHDPHKFIIDGVVAGKPFSICISGRSYKYEVYRLIVKKCSGNECKGFPINGAMGLPVTPLSCK